MLEDLYKRFLKKSIIIQKLDEREKQIIERKELLEKEHNGGRGHKAVEKIPQS